MGSLFDYKCPECDFTARCSHGHDRGFKVAVSDFMAMNSNMGEPTYHKNANVLSSVFVSGSNYSIICLGTFANKYVKLRLSSDDSLEAYKFNCIQDSTGAFCSFFT